MEDWTFGKKLEFLKNGKLEIWKIDNWIINLA